MEDNKEIEIDLRAIFFTIRKKIVFMVLIALACGAAAGCFTNFFITPKYSATITLCAYNDNNRISTDGSITSSEIDASQSLVNTYMQIIKSTTFLEKVADNLDYDISTGAIKSMVACSQVENTFMFYVQVTNTNAQEAMDIANTIAEIGPNEIVKIINAGSVQIVDYASLPSSPSSPNVEKIVVIALLAGFVASFAAFFLKEIFDTRIKDERDLEKEFDIPVLGTIPRLAPVASSSSVQISDSSSASSSAFDSLVQNKEGDKR
ncbi:MAG: Wzz/FepE/Etk N-terminal domain-containing protein [Clostridiales bacterium]|nr:Wzz/FepE/Etk N-terminal domain-containing protein [Clostridiales bacterium]